MLLTLGLFLTCISAWLMLKYLNGELVKYKPKWLPDLTLAFILIIGLFAGQWISIVEIFPPPQWLNEPPVQKESVCGTIPISS